MVAFLRSELLIRRLFLAALGSVYAVAFASLWVQVEGLAGSRGILPAQQFLDAVVRQVGGVSWSRVPTLAWLTGAGDAALNGLCAAGALSALLLLAGVLPAWTAAACWALYLSLYSICGAFLHFQWDILLLEAGFLAIFYAPPAALLPRSPAWRAPPARPVVWLLRLLIAKLMFLSGAVKLSSGDPTWRDLTALTYHYETTCLPTWTGWYMFQLPLWFHKISALGNFFVELVLPFACFGPRRLRQLAAAAFTGLMLFIGGTGNYGFFNLLTIALCLPLLDDRALPSFVQRFAARRLPEGSGTDPHRPRWPLWVTAPLALAVVALTALPVSRALRLRVQWPIALVQLYELQGPFQLVNGYGLFANMTTKRPEIIIEGSNDGQRWQAYEFRWKPGDPMQRPRFVEPHMPRLDWQMWFAALGSYGTSRWFLPFCQRLLQGSKPVLALLQKDPFPGHPPRYLRAMLYDYQFTDRSERRATGAWWKRRLLRPYLPAVELAPDGDLRAARLTETGG